MLDNRKIKLRKNKLRTRAEKAPEDQKFFIGSVKGESGILSCAARLSTPVNSLPSSS
jgi:hypothetical protein